jgi:hypothetical protein
MRRSPTVRPASLELDRMASPSDRNGPSAAGALAADHPALLLGEPTPDPRVLVGVERELEALAAHEALTADLACLLELEEGETGGPDGEEELGIGIPAQGVVSPSVVGYSQSKA